MSNAVAQERPESGGFIHGLRTLAQALSLRQGLSSLLGKTFQGVRDLYLVLGYQKEDISLDQYRFRFRRNGVARRIVTSYPDAVWKGLGELIEDETIPTTTTFEEAWFELDARLHIWQKFHRADILAGLGQYATILLGAPGSLNDELPKNLRPEQLWFIQPFSQQDMKIDSYEEDYGNERFGRPKTYKISSTRLTNTLSKNAPKAVGNDKEVHWTRVIHIPHGCLDDDILGTPDLECVWNDLDNLEKVAGGGAEAFWLRAHQGYQFDLDKDAELDETEEKALHAEVDEFLHGMRRAVRTKGVKVSTLGSDVADFGGPVKAIFELISASTGIPIRILMGSERGELASTQDDDNWQGRVNDRRTEYAGPFVVRQLVDRLIEHGVLPTPAQYDVRWPVHEPSEQEKAELGLKYADINAKAGETVVMVNEIRDRALGWSPLTDEELEELNGEEDELEGRVEDETNPEEQRPVSRAAKARMLRARRRVWATASDKLRHWWKNRNKAPKRPFVHPNARPVESA